MKTWNLGIVGAGMIADFHAKAIQHIGNARLVGITGSNKDKASSLAAKYGCRVFADHIAMAKSGGIDVITIATPSGAHLEPAIAAAEHGKHVICEKPLEISLGRVDKMIEAHEKAGTYLGGIFNYRYDDTLKPLKAAIDNERFGKITYASVHVPWWRKESYYQDSWHGTMDLDGGGALMNQSIHMIDLLQYLMGPIDSLKAFKATLAHDIEVEDVATAILRFKNGALGSIYGTTASFPGQFRRLEITGTRGTVIQEENTFKVWQFSDQNESDDRMLKAFDKTQSGGGVSDPSAISFELHRRNIADFLSSIEKGEPFWIDGREARKAVEIVTEIYRVSGEL